MRPVTFQKATLIAGEYFLGHFKWPEDMRITRATVELNPPTGSGQVRVAVEVDGVLTGKSFPIGAVPLVPNTTRPRSRFELSLNQKVPAGELIRLKVTESTSVGLDAATDATVMLYGLREVEYVETPPVLEVWWIKGQEILHLFNYNPATHAFTETATGISTGRATFTNSGPDTSMVVAIEGVTALQALGTAPKFRATLFKESMGETEIPRLEFYIDLSLVAILTKAGVFRAGGFADATPVAGNGVFEFYGGGGLVATIGIDKTTAVGLKTV